jgi:hypothetical protein
MSGNEIRIITPEQRLDNGIPTHKGIPNTFKSMNEKIKTEDFAIFDRSEQARANCKTSECYKISICKRYISERGILSFVLPALITTYMGKRIETDCTLLSHLSEPVLGLEIRKAGIRCVVYIIF